PSLRTLIAFSAWTMTTNDCIGAMPESDGKVDSGSWRNFPETALNREKESGMSEKIGVALWSLGKTRTEEDLRRSLETTVEIGLKGVQPWCVGDDCVLDPDRCVGEQRRKMRELINSYGLAISGFCAQLS